MTASAVDCSAACDVGGAACGGLKGALSVYQYAALSTAGIDAASTVVYNAAGIDVATEANTVKTGETVYLNMFQGAFECTAYGDIEDKIACKYGTTPYADEQPPLEISMDWGDGSGQQFWTPVRPYNIWKYQYTKPGTFNLYYRSKNIYKKICSGTYSDV